MTKIFSFVEIGFHRGSFISEAAATRTIIDGVVDQHAK